MHLVLDLDETLVHCEQGKDSLQDISVRKFDNKQSSFSFTTCDVVRKSGTGEVIDFYGFRRPGLENFLEFAFDYFETVNVWSAGKRKYVHEICHSIFTGERPYIIYTYDDCDRNDKHGVYKPLKLMYDDPRSRDMEATNTLILDDREDTFWKNTGNGVLIPKYDPTKCVSRYDCYFQQELLHIDNCLEQFQTWLENINPDKVRDVRLLDKSDIFEDEE